jgi:transposase-like protein
MRQRKHYTAEQKVIILRELLENNVPISQIAEKYEVRPNDIYNCHIVIPLAEEKII